MTSDDINNDFNPCKVCSDLNNNQLVFHLNNTCKQTFKKNNIRCPNCGIELELNFKPAAE